MIRVLLAEASSLAGASLSKNPAALSEGESPLTPREHEVLHASREHATVAELAQALYLSPGTVRNHLSSAMQKLDARNRAEAVRIAEEKGWL